MQLFVVRHAIAEDRDPAAWPVDSERPLTGRGRRRFRKAATGLANLVPKVDIVLSSPYLRAWDTALILQDKAGWPSPHRCDELCNSAPHEVLQAVLRHADRYSVAIVGHEPYLGEFISKLLCDRDASFLQLRKGAAAAIEFNAQDPTEPATLLWLLQPRHLRRLA